MYLRTRLVYHIKHNVEPQKLRPNQRQRTRAALVQAAMEALTRGETPTVEAAAGAARVSRHGLSLPAPLLLLEVASS